MQFCHQKGNFSTLNLQLAYFVQSKMSLKGIIMFLGMKHTRLERENLIILDFENGFLPTYLPLWCVRINPLSRNISNIDQTLITNKTKKFSHLRGFTEKMSSARSSRDNSASRRKPLVRSLRAKSSSSTASGHRKRAGANEGIINIF